MSRPKISSCLKRRQVERFKVQTLALLRRNQTTRKPCTRGAASGSLTPSEEMRATARGNLRRAMVGTYSAETDRLLSPVHVSERGKGAVDPDRRCDAGGEAALLLTFLSQSGALNATRRLRGCSVSLCDITGPRVHRPYIAGVCR